ncbi:MAG: zinc-binding dehydrogenase [Candidatus Hydrogenedentes bacterium]|nr:zinc-binding dehydrogenase [Candidatus Hydrogenedentota bacterium]
MNAALIFHHGELDCLTLGDVPEPKPAATEAVIAVRAAALNHLDIWVRKGRPGLQLKFPHVLGSDATGTVSAVGDHVQSVKVGDEVILNPGLSCGQCEYCRRGEHSECTAFGIVGLSRAGTFAESVAVPAANLYPKPEHLSIAEAAALPLAYLTAWRMLMTRAKLIAGETVLIHGIGGGVALAALELAKLAGAKVIVTSSSDAKLERAKKLRADHTVNYRGVSDIETAVRDLTGGRGVDIVFDTVGAATWAVNFLVVRKGGRIVLCGVTTGPKAEVNIAALYWNQLTILGSTMGSHEDFRRMLQAVTAAKLHPVVDSVFALGEIKDAMAKMEHGDQFGKIVLNPHAVADTRHHTSHHRQPREQIPELVA